VSKALKWLVVSMVASLSKATLLDSNPSSGTAGGCLPRCLQM
jgi:hypothetical protein